MVAFVWIGIRNHKERNAASSNIKEMKPGSDTRTEYRLVTSESHLAILSS
jgi:hypothetical protein